MTGHGGDERVPIQSVEPKGRDRPNRRRARHVTEEGDLAEEVARLQHADAFTADLDVGAAVGDHVEAVTEIPLFEDDVFGFDPNLDEGLGEPLELRRR